MSPTEKSMVLAIAGERAEQIAAQLDLIMSGLEIVIKNVGSLRAQLRVTPKPEEPA